MGVARKSGERPKRGDTVIIVKAKYEDEGAEYAACLPGTATQPCIHRPTPFASPILYARQYD